MEKYFVWHIQGGLGKNVAATSLCEDIKRTNPDRKLIMVVSWPEVFLNHPNIDRVYNIGQTPHFYDNYIHNKDTMIYRHEPYNQSGHIHRKTHLIENWCHLLNLQYREQTPKVIINYAQQQLVGMWNREKPTMVLHTNGGPIGNQKYPYNWCRDLPPELAQAIVDKFHKEYHIFQICRTDSVTLDNVERIDQQLSNLELFSLLASSKKRVLIDSCLQHAATAFGLQSTVVWVGTSPMVFGYKLHKNVVAKVPNKKNQLIGSYLFDYQFENNIHECPYINVNEMFDVNQLLREL
tara:strand:- start:214 stop:1092 length:879 start_codon:yes stop_codon:yes gene_type:complete